MRSIHTCDFFQQMMEVNQGDLADIVRATGFPQPTDPPTASWQFPPDEPPVVSYHPFSGLRDPLLHELVGMPNFDGQDASIGGKSSEEGEKLCDVFSRMQHIMKPPIVAGDTISTPRTPAIKRRKGQAKKVVCIPAPAPAPAPASSRPGGVVVPSDLWAWRKYGQKPIKGSPYPRGYYRCSSSKGCPARKQVERSRTDPNMLVITYTSDHNHQWPTQRNALAGSTRSQPSKGNSSSPKISKSSKGEPTRETMTSSNGTSPLVKEETGVIDSDGFDQFFHHSYKPMLPDSNLPDDFFADLAELDPDPMSLIFSKGFMGENSDGERESKGLDPTFNMFD